MLNNDEVEGGGDLTSQGSGSSLSLVSLLIGLNANFCPMISFREVEQHAVSYLGIYFAQFWACLRLALPRTIATEWSESHDGRPVQRVCRGAMVGPGLPAHRPQTRGAVPMGYERNASQCFSGRAVWSWREMLKVPC